MSGVNLSGTVPSRLVLLSDLRSMQVGDKVRFLGCVQKYSITTGTLTVTHHYPHNLRYPATAHVNVEHVLEGIQGDVLEVGEWINITGYITGGVTSGLGKRGGDKQWSGRSGGVGVQAVMLWSAGPITIEQYEVVLEERLRSDSMMKKGAAT